MTVLKRDEAGGTTISLAAYAFFSGVMIAGTAALPESEPVWVGKFSGAGDCPAPWRVVKISNAPPTAYRLAMVSNESAIEARVDSSMALLVRPVSVDLTRTPILCWRWLVTKIVAKGDIRKKGGNDFAARVYVAFDMPNSALDGLTKMKLAVGRRMFGKDLPDAALTYIWDNRNPVGTRMRSPYTDRQQLIVAQTGEAKVGQWVAQRANVAADFNQAFAGKPGHVVQVAVASDGDNTKSSGRAGFADLHFIARNQECRA